jgi:hypothetical protein
MTDPFVRHFVLYKHDLDAHKARFLQIMVLERERFEVRVFETEQIQLDPKFTDDNPDVDIEHHSHLVSAVLAAEKNF